MADNEGGGDAGGLTAGQEIILSHRKCIKEFNPQVADSVAMLREPLPTREMRLPVPKSLEGLQPITLQEITRVDHVYEGRVLRVRNKDPPKGYQFEDSDYYDFNAMSVALLVQDGGDDVQRVFVYNYVWPKVMDDYGNETPADKDLKAKLGRGKELCIISPVLKMAYDGKVAIVVNDPKLIHVSDAEDDLRKCGFCSQVGAVQRCGRCKVTYYCSQNCQRLDWVRLKHKYICGEKPATDDMFNERPPFSVYSLEKLCYEDSLMGMGKNSAVSVDYGFANCKNDRDYSNLLGLYQGLIKILRVDLVKLHLACINGQLKEFIIRHYAALPEESRGYYYPAFLENLDIVRNPYTEI